MKCISSPALDDTQIARYIEGEADEAVIAHIQECAYCSERASEWSLLRSGLKKQLYRMNCPTSIELGDYHLGYLPDPQRLVVAQHLRDCALCRQEMAELESFFTDLTPQTSLLETAKVLVARLMGAQAENGYAHALRGESKGPLTFEADGMVIVLDIQPAAQEHASILGQVAADEQDQWTGAVVELSQAGSLQKNTLLDEFGAFRFDDLYLGATQITIRSLHGIIVHILNVDITL